MISNRWEEQRESRWQVARPQPSAASLAERIGTAPLVAQILLDRGIDGEDQARAFLSPALSGLADPALLPGVTDAAARLLEAVRGRERILVFGDYDVDGMSGTALLVSLLERLGADASSRLPNRVSEGYGLSAAAVEEIAGSGVDLLVTVDHGTTASEEVALARELGLDVVVVDHHTPAEGGLPPASVVVNPLLHDPSGPQPCGAGLAFKVAWELARLASGGARVAEAHRSFLMDCLALVALGTVADVVPLRGENRLFVHFGLKVLAQTSRPGLRALLDTARIGDRPLEASDVAFRLAPRLNAAGRLGRAELSLELLLTESHERGREIASRLEDENRRRRKIEGEILASAQERVEAEYEPGHPGALVLGDESWHPGVIGIVAARLVDRYHRPAVLVAFDRDVGRGSCRTIPALALPEALSRCSDHLEAFGGHAAAAGLTVSRENFGAFREAFDGVVRTMLVREDFVRLLRVDAVVRLSEIDPPLVREIERLAPFGEGNRRPTLATRSLRVAGRPRRLGREGRHLGLLVSDGSATFRAVGFGMGPLADTIEKASRGVDIAYTPRFDTWRDDGSLELLLRDVCPATSPAESPGGRERLRP